MRSLSVNPCKVQPIVALVPLCGKRYAGILFTLFILEIHYITPFSTSFHKQALANNHKISVYSTTSKLFLEIYCVEIYEQGLGKGLHDVSALLLNEHRDFIYTGLHKYVILDPKWFCHMPYWESSFIL